MHDKVHRRARIVDRGGSSNSIVVDYTVPSRARTLNLLRLCLVTYASCKDRQKHGFSCGFADQVMQPIWDAGESIYNTRDTNRSSADEADQNFYKETLDSIQKLSCSGPLRDISAPNSAKYNIGVEATEWSAGNTTILAFRGTFTDGDYANIENWMTDYLIEKSTNRMRDAWTKDANLTWTPAMQKRADRSDTFEKLLIRAAETHFFYTRTGKEWVDGEQSFPKELSLAVASDKNLSDAIGGMSYEEAEATGYWKITKYIVDNVVANLPQGNTLVLTGHSQGGTRAQFAAMYLNHTIGWNPPTVTFAATGSACAARHFFSKKDILEDLDPFLEYEKMVEYVHPLDPWGNAMLGLDNGKDVCFFGTKALREAEAMLRFDGAYKYCSRVYGWSGPTIIVARNGITGPGGPSNPHELDRNFARCRYFTHQAASMLLALQADGALDADGTPDGGCRRIPVIPKNDTNGLCPTGKIPLGEVVIATELLILFILLVFLSLFGMCSYCQRCCNIMKSHFEDRFTTFLPVAGTDEDEEGVAITELPQIA